MRKVILFILSVLFLSVFFAGCSSQKKDTVVIGAKNFTEQDILGNVLKILIDEHTDLNTRVTFNLDSLVVYEAVKSGNVDLYVDYTGTVYGNYFGYTERKTPEEIFEISRKELKEKFNILMLDQIGFNNTYTLSVRKDTAEKYNLKTISDLARVSPELIIGASIESFNREDSVKGVISAYGMNFKGEIAVEGNLRYTAIENDEIQVTDAFSTDGMTMRYELLTLEDDKGFFLAYYATVLVRGATAEKYPQLLTVMNKLLGKLDDNSMRDLNYRVDVLQEDPQQVARSFLKSAGLIK